MARSNQGGTRGFIRGRVANDLYQVTKNARGRRIQLVRAVEESRINNNTLEQALARMRMALLMGALKDLKEIVDHSWQGIPYGQLSIANFVKVNMPLVTADCRENWNGENSFCYPEKGLSDMRIGAFLIADGTLTTPNNITKGVNYEFGRWFPFRILICKADPTFGDLRACLGLNASDYITMLTLAAYSAGTEGVSYPAFLFTRLYLADNVSDDTIITDDNLATLFTCEGSATFQLSVDVDSGVITVQLDMRPDGIPRSCQLCSVITSRWDGKQWCRNKAAFTAPDGHGGLNFEAQAPRWRFQSWYPSFDPDGDEAGHYPGK